MTEVTQQISKHNSKDDDLIGVRWLVPEPLSVKWDSGRKAVIAGGTCGDGAAWMVDEAYSLVIGGTGYVSSEPWSGMKDSIKEIIIGDGITEMNDYILQIYKNVEAVTIGKNMNSFDGTVPS